MNLKEMSDRELLERIYSAQLSTIMQIETILCNVEELKKSTLPNSDVVCGRQQMTEIHKETSAMYGNFISQLESLKDA